MDYIAAVSNCLGYCETIEKLLGVTAPPRAQYIRTIMTELNRISSHLLWLGTHALDIGAMTVFLYAFREREEILKIFENYCGARLTTHMFRIGGTQYEMYEGFQDQVKTFIKDFPGKVDEYETLLTENRIWIGRTRGVGVISAKDAIDYRFNRAFAARFRSGMGFSQGKALCGLFRFRIRYSGGRARRYLRPVHGPNGRDAAVVPHRRSGDRKDSRWTIDGQDYEDHQAAGRRHLSFDRSSERRAGLLHGERRCTQAYRARVRPPSFVNLQALRQMVIGSMVADVVAVIGTLDIVLGEIDR